MTVMCLAEGKGTKISKNRHRLQSSEPARRELYSNNHTDDGIEIKDVKCRDTDP